MPLPPLDIPADFHLAMQRAMEARLVWLIRGDFARGQRTQPIAPENGVIPVGSFGDTQR